MATKKNQVQALKRWVHPTESAFLERMFSVALTTT